MSIVVHAGDLLIEQDGNRGMVDVSIDSGNHNIAVHQGGIENLLDAGFGSDITAFIEQTGNNGKIYLQALNGVSNRLEIDQLGEHNHLTGEFTGNATSTSIDQSGTGNSLLIDVSGNAISLDIDQSGRRNWTSLSLDGNNVNFDVAQSGHNNNIDASVSNSNLSINIMQSGSGETITIDN